MFRAISFRDVSQIGEISDFLEMPVSPFADNGSLEESLGPKSQLHHHQLSSWRLLSTLRGVKLMKLLLLGSHFC